MKKTIGYLIAGLFVFGLVNCKQKSETRAGLKGHFTFVKGNVTVNQTPVKIGSKVSQSDVVEVADKSGAIIQFATGAVLTLKSNTVLQVSQLAMGPDGKPQVALNQEVGSTFSKIVPGKAKYKVSTPTAVAGVRGTAFEVNVTKSRKTAVKLLHGKVAVAKKAPKAESADKAEEAVEAEEAIILEEGTKVEITPDKVEKPKKLAKADIKELKQLDKIEVIEDEKALENPEALQEKVKEIVPVKVEKLIVVEKPKVEEKAKEEKPAKKKPMTLEDLKQKYGKLSQITTRDGKKYIGAFKQQGGNIEIQTLKGKVKVPVNEVAKVSPLN